MTKILMATDGSEHAAKIIDETISLARAFDANVSVLSVAEVPAHIALDMAALYRERIEKEVRETLDKTKKHFAEKGLTVEAIFKSGHPSTVICAVAEEGSFDIIVIGSRGLGKIKELILGSVSNRVAHCAKASVYIVK
jgi:nucleotide-binding universal stress UspA family protein